MPVLLIRYDHQPNGEIKTREFPIDTQLRIIGTRFGYSSLERLDPGVWVPELTTPGPMFIQGRAY